MDFRTFGAKALAGIGSSHDTVADRSIPIRMKRVSVAAFEKFRKREVEREASRSDQNSPHGPKPTLKIADARPEIPSTFPTDRRIVRATACHRRTRWRRLARTTRCALVELCCEAQADDQSTGVRLLQTLGDFRGSRC